MIVLLKCVCTHTFLNHNCFRIITATDFRIIKSPHETCLMTKYYFLFSEFSTEAITSETHFWQLLSQITTPAEMAQLICYKSNP